MTQLLEAGLLWVKPGIRVWTRRPNQHPSLPFTDPRPGQAILRPYQGYCRVLRNSFHELDCSEIPECLGGVPKTAVNSLINEGDYPL